MFRQLLPEPAVAVVEAQLVPRPLSAAVLSAYRVRRDAERNLGDRCARLALDDLGIRDGIKRSGTAGEPLWPDGVIGSVTHRGGYAAAAVSYSTWATGFGIDVELARALSADVAERVCTPDELAELDLQRRPLAATITFSIKESVYKAVYGALHLRLDWFDATVSIVGQTGSVEFFGARARHASLGGYAVDARWAEGGGLIATVAVLREVS